MLLPDKGAWLHTSLSFSLSGSVDQTHSRLDWFRRMCSRKANKAGCFGTTGGGMAHR
jgi:hypothetical protein